MFLKCKKRVLP